MSPLTWNASRGYGKNPRKKGTYVWKAQRKCRVIRHIIAMIGREDPEMWSVPKDTCLIMNYRVTVDGIIAVVNGQWNY